jgi:amino acid transporter
MRDGRVQDLSRKLRLFPATNIVVADMIGVGIFTTSGLLLGELGSPVLMVGLWVGGGVLALCGALCYGELGAAIPRAGGEYVYLSKLFHPLLGFLTGWVSLFAGFSAPLAASSLGFSEGGLGGPGAHQESSSDNRHPGTYAGAPEGDGVRLAGAELPDRG